MMKHKVLFFFVLLAAVVLSISCSNASSGGDTGSGSLDLATLSVSGQTLVPAFDPAVTDYAVTVSGAVSTVTVSATTVDKYAGLGISPSWTFNRSALPADVMVTVNSRDLTTWKHYTIKFSTK